MNLSFIGLTHRNVASINKFLKSLSSRPNVDLEQHAKVLRKCGEKILHRRSYMFNKLVLWLAYYRELRYHAPDVSSLLDEFEVQAGAVTRRAHVYPFRKPVQARPHLRTLEATGFRDDARTDVEVVQNTMISATALARLSECQPLTPGEVAFIQLREKDVMELDKSLDAIYSNMFVIQPVKLTIERHCNSSLVNATNKLVYLGKVIVAVKTSWNELAEKCIVRIKELCKSLLKELRTCRSFESNYCSNIIKHGVHDGESADMVLEMLMEDFNIYEDIFPRSSEFDDRLPLEYDDEELNEEWRKWLRDASKQKCDYDSKLETKKYDFKKPSGKTDRQVAFSMLSPTEKRDFWEKPVATKPSAKRRVTFWSDDESDWKENKAEKTKGDSMLDLGDSLESLKLDSTMDQPMSTYKFEPPKLVQSSEYNPFLQPLPKFTNEYESFKPLPPDDKTTVADWTKTFYSGLPTSIVPLSDEGKTDVSDEGKTDGSDSSDVEKKPVFDLSDIDFTDPNSSFSPAKRREVNSGTEGSDSDGESVTDLFSDNDGVSDAESVVSVRPEKPPPKTDRQILVAKKPTVRPKSRVTPKPKVIPKPKPSLGPFPQASPNIVEIKPPEIKSPEIKAPKSAKATPVVKPATLVAPTATETATTAKVIKPSVDTNGIGVTPAQVVAQTVTTKTPVKSQTASSTEGTPAAKVQAKKLAVPAVSKTADVASPAKAEAETDTTGTPEAIKAIIEKIKEDARENEE
ncbi:tegument protein pp150 [Cercopithecine betaherpesvirus 5]|uniref:Tegument protein pp150 n=1 Tax=Simian cytomegalovirus (strain Colburn) TaxID=50292 RepID=G8XTA4_SCMVC|nr:tegument protein pp150 [Cercopithecine betaherpesvirus 5]AEV80397.1 tegument protein pp150 [Cercopithecine betaherpesvirus 5]